MTTNLAALIGPGFLNALWVALLAAFSQYVTLRAGVFSMATAGFMAIGAYSVAILTVKFQVAPALAVIVAVGLATLAGIVLGALVGKLRGAYQGIATLSFVLILQHVISLWDMAGGHFGISGIPLFSTQTVFLIAIGAVLLLIVLLEISPIGRQQAGVRIDEIAAASLGVNAAVTSLVSLAFSAAIGGLAGALLAGNQFAIDPGGFSFELVITTLAAVIIGGYRSFLGPICGAVITVALPLIFSKYQALAGAIVGCLTIIILMLTPGGLATGTRLDSELIINFFKRPRRPRLPEQDAALELHQEHQLVAEEITRSYGAVRAVDGVSLTVKSGQIVGLIGPNGAGKTSVINLLAGVTALNAGRIMLDGVPIDKLPAYEAEKRGIARTFQACRLFHENTVWSNVLFAATSGRTREQRRKVSDVDCASAAMELVGCHDFAHRRAGDLAYAFQRRTEIARALACQPKFLLLDEPAAGMTQSESEDLGQTLKAAAASGVGILVVDHNVPWMLSICDFINVQHHAKLIASGPPDMIRDDPVVIGAYIGNKRGKRAREDRWFRSPQSHEA